MQICGISHDQYGDFELNTSYNHKDCKEIVQQQRSWSGIFLPPNGSNCEPPKELDAFYGMDAWSPSTKSGLSI